MGGSMAERRANQSRQMIHRLIGIVTPINRLIAGKRQNQTIATRDRIFGTHIVFRDF
jgi:hypothetical protein